MIRKIFAAIALVVVGSASAAAQDAKTVVSNASKAMGVDGLNSIHYYGVAQNGNLGQNNNANQPWPMATPERLRARDRFLAAGVAGDVGDLRRAGDRRRGALCRGHRRQQNITPQNTAWAQQLEIWITPWGFLKGAAANNATVRSQTVGGPALSGRDLQRAGQVARRAAVPSRRLHQRAEPGRARADVAGEPDLRRHARRGGIHALPRHQRPEVPGADGAEARRLAGVRGRTSSARDANPGEHAAADDGAAATGRRGGGAAGGAPGGGTRRPPPPTSEKLADGVFRITGAYNALAVEFADHIVLFEPGPQNEARAQAIIAETKTRDPEQADPLRRDLAPSFRSHQRPAGRRSPRASRS